MIKHQAFDSSCVWTESSTQGAYNAFNDIHWSGRAEENVRSDLADLVAALWLSAVAADESGGAKQTQ